ncbi:MULTISPECIES: YciI family protein [Pseudoalteromonas]|uniref:YciI family protein n=1 Tax=Pseudoalteromonas obscura TaxID=3048491 RepID=A0ABT7EGD7_9GAMM|nr:MULTISPECIES: YciI family protein [Pseudoalteromonas]MBQ4835637.1 GTP cyclohydrolase [Pseudoalteromonas luteoviolacea]MDK2594111.1 YciI family protein [Pseudoalteromonas sp. P94(2023)]
MFIVTLNYLVGLSEVEKYLPLHIEYLDQCYDDGIFLMSGPTEPRTGGVILAASTSKESLEATLNEDPFYKTGIADYQITEFVPTKSMKELNYLL